MTIMTHVTITLYAYILACFLVPLAPKQRKCDIWYHYFYRSKLFIDSFNDSN